MIARYLEARRFNVARSTVVYSALGRLPTTSHYKCSSLSHMKSSSSSLPVFLGRSPSPSSVNSPLNNESYERAAFSASRARACSTSAFFLGYGFINNPVRQVTKMWRVNTDLGSGSSPFHVILSFDAIYSFLFMIDLFLDFGLVQAVDDWVLPCLYVHCAGIRVRR